MKRLEKGKTQDDLLTDVKNEILALVIKYNIIEDWIQHNCVNIKCNINNLFNTLVWSICLHAATW